MFMNFVETEIQFIHYFKFLLPARSFGIKSDELIEFNVDYGISDSSSCVSANVWASRKGGSWRQFITSIDLPEETELGHEIPGKIVVKLNDDEDFNARMYDFAPILLAHPHVYEFE